MVHNGSLSLRTFGALYVRHTDIRLGSDISLECRSINVTAVKTVCLKVVMSFIHLCIDAMQLLDIS